MRWNPHLNKRNLQLVQMTQELFPNYESYFSDPMEAMRAARTEAGRILKKKEKKKARIKRRQQQVARKINFGLLPAGSRP